MFHFNQKIFGYIEGYYGNILSWRSRKRIIVKMRMLGMNFYFYAPKEDIHHRLHWRKKYTKAWQSNFKNFCLFAKANNIQIIVGISPGIDFNYDTILKKNNKIENDLVTLINKFKTLLDCGADYAALLFDDIEVKFNKYFPKKLEGEIHANLINTVSNRLKKNIFTVPRIYSDELIRENNEYLKSFMRKVNNDTNIFYCGRYIVNNKFETRVNSVNKKLKNNKIIFWDNYYANDYCPKRLILGPWMVKNQKKVMLNLTGMIETDLFLLELASKCRNSNNIIECWKELLIKNKVPTDFFNFLIFFEKPNLTSDKDKLNIEFEEEMLDKLDDLIWKWKTPLSREWYPYLLSLKQDLQILLNKITFNRVLKTQSYPMAKVLKNQWRINLCKK